MSLNYSEYIKDLIAKGHAAQKIANGFDQEMVEKLTAAVAYQLTKPEVALRFGEMLVEESGMGVATDKQLKMYGKVKGSYFQMKGKTSVGLYAVDEAMGIETYAKPMGVIGALVPVTNGEATPVVKALMALKTRNAIILAPHPKARKSNFAVVEMIRETIVKMGAPADLVQAIDPEYVSIEASGILMKEVDFILATGGTPMVREAYSSGNPAIGVGTGNVVTIVDGTSDLDAAADMIIRSKTFDNATSCSTENNIIVFESCYDGFMTAMAKKGAVLLTEESEDKAKLLKALWPASPENHDLNRHIVAQSAEVIAAAELIKEIVATLKAQNLEIFFRMDSGYFDEEIIETIESLGCKYLIKAKAYATLVSQVTASSAVFLKGIDGRETAELLIKLDKWKKKRRFVVSRVLKPEKERAQLSLLEGSEYDYFFFVTNTDLESEAVVLSYEKRGNAENYIKEAKYDMSVGHLLLKSFWANEAVFQMMMLSYNLFLLFKFDYLDVSEYRQQIKTFRLKYVFLAAKIIKTARSVIMKLSSKYPYQEVYKKCICLES